MQVVYTAGGCRASDLQRAKLARFVRAKRQGFGAQERQPKHAASILTCGGIQRRVALKSQGLAVIIDLGILSQSFACVIACVARQGRVRTSLSVGKHCKIHIVRRHGSNRRAQDNGAVPETKFLGVQRFGCHESSVRAPGGPAAHSLWTLVHGGLHVGVYAQPPTALPPSGSGSRSPAEHNSRRHR